MSLAMMRKLVITEKSNVARRISAILSDGKSHSSTNNGVNVISFGFRGDNYNVISLRGHIIKLDYPEKYNDWKNIQPIDLVYAPNIKTVSAESTLNAIKSLCIQTDEVIIATDYDREGELIGLETVIQAGIDIKTVKRAKFSALTRDEIRSAFISLVNLNKKLADSAEARSIIDLSWGAVLTRLISISSGQIGRNFMSVGRVQSPTLKLIVDRHEEIKNFKPIPYWDIIGKFGISSFEGYHEDNNFWEKNKAETILSRVCNQTTGKVTEYEISTKKECRPTPFDTTQMQVEASKIGIQPVNTMKLAEDLYIRGYISYPRTDNTEYPKSLNLRDILIRLRGTKFKREVDEVLSQGTILPSRGKKRTTDHPPIYPTAAASTGSFKGDKWKLYELIVRRFLSTLGLDAEARIIRCVVNVNGENFVLKGYTLQKYGWKKYYKKYIKIVTNMVPTMNVGDSIPIESISLVKSETRPPYRYNQGQLIQDMDKFQLGTKSTRHDIINKLFSRDYIQGNYIIPTPGGIALTKSLEKHGGGITDTSMTAKLELDMIKISNGDATLDAVVEESKGMLYNIAKKITESSNYIGQEIKYALQSQQYVGTCPYCGNNMSIKRSKNGNFIGCDGYPKCKHAYPIPKWALVQTAGTNCHICGLPQIKIIRRGNLPSIQCIDPKCSSNTDRNSIGPCPTCHTGNIRIVFSKNGARFAGCSSWPVCTQTYPLKSNSPIIPTKKSCELCKAPIIIIDNIERCINPKCLKSKNNILEDKKY